MNLNPVAKGIAHEKPFPWRRTAILSLHARRLQPGAQAIHLRTFQTEMPVFIRRAAYLLDRHMHIPSPSIEPHATTPPQNLWFGNLRQARQSVVKCPGDVLPALGHRDVYVGKVHIAKDGSRQEILPLRKESLNRGFADFLSRCLSHWLPSSVSVRIFKILSARGNTIRSSLSK
jgi:hypothetical protein